MAYSGVVRCAKTGKPLTGIPVSDGKNIVKTDENGQYTLPGWERAQLIYANVLTCHHEDWYQKIQPEQSVYDFALNPVEQTSAHTFIHMSDTEAHDVEDEECCDWVEFVREKAEEEKAAFIIHGGDICNERGMPRHRRIMNSENMGVPVRYSMGNHDIKGKERGESLYEDLFGPCWYSFDCGNVHYMVTSIYLGDFPSGYLPEDQWDWIYEDLKQKDPNKGLVIFNHGGCMGRYMKEFNIANHEFIIDSDGHEELLKGNGLLAAIFGHLHIHYHNQCDGFHYVCTANPKEGGIDASATGIRIVQVEDDQTIGSRMAYFDDRKFSAPAADALWSTQLNGDVLHCTPLVYENTLLIGTSDDGWPKNCGVSRLDECGKLLWFYPTKDSVKNDLAVAEGMVFAQDCSGNVYAIDVETGCEKWQTKVDLGVTFYNHCCISVYKGKVFAGGCRRITALDLQTGKSLWESMSYEDGEPSAYRPVFYQNLLIMGSCWRRVYALDVDTGKQVWLLDPGQSRFFYATPLVEGDQVMVPAGSNLYILSAATGSVRKLIGKRGIGFDVSAQPVRDGNVYYFGTVENGVVALKADDFSLLRRYPAGKCLTYTSGYSKLNDGTVDGHILVDGAYLRFAASDGYLYTYGKDTGLLVDRQWMGAPSFVAPVCFGGGIAVADLRGKLTVFPKV